MTGASGGSGGTVTSDPAGGEPSGEPGGNGRRPGGLLGLPPPERRRRGDLVAAALIVVAALVGTVLVLATGNGAGTEDRTSVRPLLARPEGPVPTTLAEVWRAESPATPAPVALAGAVVTAGPGGVLGHDVLTGAVAWSYTRAQPPCTVGSGFGDVLAVFRDEGPLGVYCSDVVALQPENGSRGPARNADLREGTRLLTDRDHVTGTGRDYLETWRSDLVETTEIGNVPTPVHPPSDYPRAACTNGSVAVGGSTVGTLARCPGEPSDRLTVFKADPSSSEVPDELTSVLLGVRGARLVALTDRRAAWAGPDGSLHVVVTSGEGAGTETAAFPLGAAAGPTTDPPDLAAVVRPVGSVLLWWTGTATVALDAGDLRPRWSVPGTLGAGAAWPGSGSSAIAVVPITGGLLVLDAATGTPRGPTIPVVRDAPGAPVTVTVSGTTVLEQRGTTLVALRSRS